MPKYKVVSITQTSTFPVAQKSDGGFLVEEETETVAYYGVYAKKLLRRTLFFDKETQIINPSSGKIQILKGKDKVVLHDSGSFEIGSGTYAAVDVLEGSPLVICTKNQPQWYTKLAPIGEHKQVFKMLVHLNKHHSACHINKNKFNEHQLKKLLDAGVIEEVFNENRTVSKYVKWSNFDTCTQLKNVLLSLKFSTLEIEQFITLWQKLQRIKKQYLESIEIQKNTFDPDTEQSLIALGILIPSGANLEGYVWSHICTEEKLKSKLYKSTIIEEKHSAIVDIWKSTTRRGFDNSGLIWSRGKACAYNLKHKINMWNQDDTEWSTNSTACAGSNDPFIAGVSNVVSKHEYPEPTAFKKIRAGEVLHKHPILGCKKQTEIYLSVNGRCALFVIQNQKPGIHILEPGDMAIINPGVIHCVIAFQGNYEHLAFQVPNTFQYGFMFKHDQKFSDYGITEEYAQNMAFEELRNLDTLKSIEYCIKQYSKSKSLTYTPML